MTEIIYDGSKDRPKNCGTITKADDKVYFNYYCVYHGQIAMKTIDVTKVTMYKRFIIMIEPLDTDTFVVLFNKTTNLVLRLSCTDCVTKFIEYGKYFHVFSEGSENTYYARYGFGDTIEKDLDVEAIKKDVLTLLMPIVNLYIPEHVNYGDTIIDMYPVQVQPMKIVSGFWDISF